MMDGITDALAAEAGAPAVMDGAWGTELQRRGLALGECADLWNVTRPERVAGVARAYVAAGSRVIMTNTFGANRLALARHGLAERAADLARAGARLSREAADGAPGRVWVYASMGPSGTMREPGNVLEAAFREQAEALAEGGADALVIETMTTLEEARIAVRAARSTGLPVVASMVFGLPGGPTPEDAARAMEAEGASAVGANCGTAAELLEVCRRMRAVTALPLWMKPSAGLPELLEGRAVYRLTPEEYAAGALALVGAGARFIGGCCGVGPEHIGSLGRWVVGSLGTAARGD